LAAAMDIRNHQRQNNAENEKKKRDNQINKISYYHQNFFLKILGSKGTICSGVMHYITIVFGVSDVAKIVL
jgi:hypothetical protein